MSSFCPPTARKGERGGGGAEQNQEASPRPICEAAPRGRQGRRGRSQGVAIATAGRDGGPEGGEVRDHVRWGRGEAVPRRRHARGGGKDG